MATDDVRFFVSPEEFRKWLEEHHNSRQQLWVGFHREKSGRPGITWPEAVDEALSFGWIDGKRKSIDDADYKDSLHTAQTGQHLEQRQHQAGPGTHRTIFDAAGRPQGLSGQKREQVGHLLI